MAARHLHTAPVWLLMATLLAACAVTPTGLQGDATPAPRATRKPSAAPSASAKPTEPVSAASTAATPPGSVATSPSPVVASSPATLAPAPLAKLAKPLTASRTLAGVVRIDAGYAISAGSARLISNNGGTALGAPGAALLEGAGNLIANNGGGLVGNNGGALISDNGGALISDSGGTLISDKGGTVIANNAAGLVSKRQLLQAPAASAASASSAPAPGAVLPAGGLVVAVMSLRTGLYYPLGQDAAGKPVYAVLTNAQGGFEVYPPADAGPLLVVARFPEEAAGAQADPRLAYDLLQDQVATGAPAPADVVVDEDTSQVTRYVRTACAGTFQKFTLTDDVEQTVANISKDAPPALREPLNGLVREMRQISAEVGLDKAPPAVTGAVATRMADVLLSYMGIDNVTLSRLYWPEWTGPEEPAIPALVDIMRRVREGTNTRFAADPGFFAALPEVVEANALLPADAPRWTMRKPADLNDFVVRAIVVPDRGAQRTEAVFAAVGVEAYQSKRLYAAVNNYIAVMAATALAVPEAKAAVFAEIRKPR